MLQRYGDLPVPTLSHPVKTIGSLRYLDTSGQKDVVLESQSTSIGRATNQDIVFVDPKVSRFHAVILRDGLTYSVIDQNSTRGTYLNGQRVQRALLKHGDVLQFGSTTGARLQFDAKIGRAHV